MIRFGVIGTNWITDRLLTAAAEHSEFQLTAVYSRTKDRATQFAKKYGVGTIFTDLEEMASSDAIDAVYIASPNALHARHALLFIKQGKHVLCEKPLASNAAEVSEMVAAAQLHQVVLMEALKTTLTPNFLVIRDQLKKIGKVRRYFANYCQYSSRYEAYKEGRIMNAFKPELSNGALMDIGIYCLYPLIVLFGKPDQVKASGVLLDTGVDGEGSLLLQYQDMDAVVTFSKITNSSLPCEIQGEEGNLVFDKINIPEEVVIHYRNGAVENLTQPQSHEPMYYEVEEFVRLVKAGQIESTINSHQASLQVMEIIDECRRQIGVVYPADKK